MGFVVHVEVRNQGQHTHVTVGEVMYRDMAKANSRRSHTNTLTQTHQMVQAPPSQVKVVHYNVHVAANLTFNGFMPNTLISVKILYTVRADYAEQRTSCPHLFNSFVL